MNTTDELYQGMSDVEIAALPWLEILAVIWIVAFLASIWMVCSYVRKEAP